MRPSRLIAASLAAVALAVAPAGAAERRPAPVPVAPVADATLAAGSPFTLQARPPAPGQQVTIAISALPDLAESGALRKLVVRRIARPSADPAISEITVSSEELAEGRPGRYYWQALVEDPGGQVAGPVGSFTLLRSAGARARTAIPGSIGRHGSSSFYLSTAGIPDGVERTTFGELARRSGRRWGLTPRRWTPTKAGRADGWSIVGFGSRVTGSELGVERDLVVKVYRRHQQCLTLRGPDGEVMQRSCRQLPATYVGRRTIERDITLRRDIAWSTRSDVPDVDRYDLETVLIHEFGHMAGNKSHRQRCADSPMVETLGVGEWWHTSQDHFQFACERYAAWGAAASRTRGLRLAHREVVVGSVFED